MIRDNFMTFSTLGLSAPILKAVAGQGYETPSPVQARAIPAVIEGRDVMAAAQTGTGKTLVFHPACFRKAFERGPGSVESGACPCFGAHT